MELSGRKPDFSGWATKNDILCLDGRTIRHNAFINDDGKKVPLVWNHQHSTVDAILGSAILHNCDEGVRVDGYFNDKLEKARLAKELVKEGNINSLSIYANELKQNGGDVIHGSIKEVSLVIGGANRGAVIDDVITHSADGDSAIICMYEGLTLEHSGTETKKEKDVNVDSEFEDGETVGDVLDSLSDKQYKTVMALFGQILSDVQAGAGQTEKGDTPDMVKHNVFDNDTNENSLAHAMACMEADVIGSAKAFGSMRESFDTIAHSAEYGIEQIDWLQPEFQSVTGNIPPFIQTRPTEWVQSVLGAVHHTPFSKIKMMFADITGDEARAKGYIKGNYKKEEVFSLLRRTVSATTIYKKQKMDRDDVIEITDFDVVSWIKGEMRLKLDEELARAILFGDGRSAMSEDKISEANIIPITKDADFYCIKKTLSKKTGESEEHALIDACVLAQDDYEGSGNITAVLPAKAVTRMLLMEDVNGRRLYKNQSDIANAMGVDKILKVPASICPDKFKALLVDFSDYNVGADKGGAINMFEDFDIDYNQEKYLIETRCSGALIKPYSAIVISEE